MSLYLFIAASISFMNLYQDNIRSYPFSHRHRESHTLSPSQKNPQSLPPLGTINASIRPVHSSMIRSATNPRRLQSQALITSFFLQFTQPHTATAFPYGHSSYVLPERSF